MPPTTPKPQTPNPSKVKGAPGKLAIQSSFYVHRQRIHVAIMTTMRILRLLSVLVAHVVASEHDASLRCNTDEKVGGDRKKKQ